MPGAISQLLAKVVDIFFSESGQNMATSGVGIPVGPDGAVRHIFCQIWHSDAHGFCAFRTRDTETETRILALQREACSDFCAVAQTRSL